MRLIILLLAFLNITALSESDLVEFKLINPQTKEVNNNLFELMDLLSVDYKNRDIDSVHNLTQSEWLRKPGVIRDELMEVYVPGWKRRKAIQIIGKMGFKNQENSDEMIDCKYYLSFVTTLWRVKQRIKNMVEQIESGNLSCQNIVLLGGNRLLSGQEINEIKENIDISILLKSCGKKRVSHLNESDLNKYIWRHSKLIPVEIKLAFKEGKNLFFVDCDHYKQSTPITVQELIYSWLDKYKPEPGNCCSGIEQPYSPRIRNVIGHIFMLHNKGKDEDQHFTLSWQTLPARRGLWLSWYLDSISRAFYQEKWIIDSREAIRNNE